jgi:hypothetical protein
MKKARLSKSTPAVVQSLNTNIELIADIHRQLIRRLYAVAKTHQRTNAIRKQAYDDGYPGSNEVFNTAIFNLEDEAKYLIQVAQGIVDKCLHLRNTPPENWK